MGAPEPAGQSGAAPTCFRHPGRETYVSCVRCGRYACPDCLRSAPVGQQCVECIREGQRRVPHPTTVFGGRVTSGGAVVTWVLVAINVAVYIGELADRKLIDYLAMIGRATDPALGGQIVGVGAGQWYRLITSAFLHTPSPLHILFNMWALAIVGPQLERLLGRTRFLILYLLSALGGSVLYYLIGPPTQLALGASGAIFGLFGAYFVAARRLQLDARWIVGLIVINLVITFAVRSIAWQAHVGGLVTGGAVMAAYAYAPRPQRLLLQAGASAAVLALLVIGVVLRTHQLTA